MLPNSDYSLSVGPRPVSRSDLLDILGPSPNCFVICVTYGGKAEGNKPLLPLSLSPMVV